MKLSLRGMLTAAAVFSVAMTGAAAEAKARKSPLSAARAFVDKSFAAREAYYSGEVEKALELAPNAGERWIAGLAAYRLGKYQDARGFFEFVATDPTEDEWLRAAAAFWAARAVSAAGAPQDAIPLLRMAAQTPHTVYGMIAARQLDLSGEASFVRVASYAGVNAGYYGDDHPTPELTPYGGFTIDKALVYALVRTESRFNPYAVSPVGAIGLMQLMPGTAAQAAGDDSLKANVLPLFDPATNLRYGQDYFSWLLEKGVGGHDILKAVAAYNGGPGAVIRTADRVGWTADPLLFIESLPAKETREYVEKVMASYWTYRRKFGEQTATLDALASGKPVVDYRLDQYAFKLEPVSMSTSGSSH